MIKLNQHSKRPPNGPIRANCNLIAAIILPLILSLNSHANEVFVSQGEYGEVSFSDANLPGATRIEAPVQPYVGNPGDEHIDAMLRVAGELERSRLAREARRDRSREQRARENRAQANRQAPVVRDRVIYRGGFAFRNQRGFRHRDGFRYGNRGNRGGRRSDGASADSGQPAATTTPTTRVRIRPR